ncbi:MAG: hypothetical protein K6G80_10415 [Treponema sp.]|nr:hypothetical protein [Treponema sp.]
MSDIEFRNKIVYFFLAASLSILIPAPGRFAYGLVLLLVFNFQIICGLLFSRLINFLNLNALKNALMAMEIVAVTIFCKQILVLICPIMALTLGFVMYLPVLSAAIIDFLYKETERSMKKDICQKMILSGSFSLLALLFFLIRDVFGYGTITMIAYKRIAVVTLPVNTSTISASSFLATIPGALLFLSLAFALYVMVRNKYTVLKRGEES